MSERIEIDAELRTDVGKGASRRLRRLADKVPGIIYGSGKEPVALTLEHRQLAKAMEEEAFFSQVIVIKAGKKKQDAVVRDVQRHPASEKVMHIDFLRVSADTAIQVHVPLHFLNEETCIGVKMGGGSVSRNLVEVEISCLPGNLPEYIELDIKDLDVGSALHLSDLELPEGVELTAFSHGDVEGRDSAVVSVIPPRAGSEEEEAEEVAPEEGGEEAASEEGGADES